MVRPLPSHYPIHDSCWSQRREFLGLLHSLHVEEKEVWGHQLVVHLLVYLAVFFADHSFVTALLNVIFKMSQFSPARITL